MANPPVAKKKMGSVTLSLWEKEWEGKKLLSYTLQKRYKKKDSDEWVNTEFFNLSDLPNVLALIQDTILNNIKKEKVVPKGEQPITPDGSSQDIPF
jgi:hypothetical protein